MGDSVSEQQRKRFESHYETSMEKMEEIYEHIMINGAKDPPNDVFRSKRLASRKLAKQVDYIPFEEWSVIPVGKSLDKYQRHFVSLALLYCQTLVDLEDKEVAYTKLVTINDYLTKCTYEGPLRMMCWTNLALSSSTMDKMDQGVDLLNQCLDYYKDSVYKTFWSDLDYTTEEKDHLQQTMSITSYFQEGVQVYKDEVDTSTHPCMYRECDVIYTHVLFYLAQIHQKLGNIDDSAWYSYLTLQAQHKYMRSAAVPQALVLFGVTPKFDPFDWMSNALFLGYYFLNQHDLDTAYLLFLNCFHAKTQIKAMKTSSDKEDDRESKNMDTDHRTTQNDICRILVKYCIKLLEKVTPEPSDRVKYPFTDIYPLNEMTNAIKLVPKVTPTRYEEARSIYLFAISQLEKALQYFTLNTYCSDHMDCLFDYSSLHRLMIEYIDPDLKGDKCKLYKRRIDLFEVAEKSLNIVYFLPTLRKIYMELGDCITKMVDLKLDLMQQEGVTGDVAMKKARKIKSLALQGVQCFYRFTMTFNDKYANTIGNTQNMQLGKVQDDYVQDYMMCYLQISSLYRKIPPDSGTPDDLNKCRIFSITTLQVILKYWDKFPDQRNLFQEQKQLADEFLKLIPAEACMVREL